MDFCSLELASCRSLDHSLAAIGSAGGGWAAAREARERDEFLLVGATAAAAVAVAVARRCSISVMCPAALEFSREFSYE